MKKLLTALMPEGYGLSLAGLMLIFFSLSSQAQSFIVKGVVTGKPDGAPLDGVSVRVKGSARATQTNTEGKFEISASARDVLQFSFVGYTPVELPASETSLQVSLEQATGAL